MPNITSNGHSAATSEFAFVATLCQYPETLAEHDDVVADWITNPNFKATFQALHEIAETGETIDRDLCLAYLDHTHRKVDQFAVRQLFDEPVSGTALTYHKRNLRKAWTDTELLRIRADIQRAVKSGSLDDVAKLLDQAKRLESGDGDLPAVDFGWIDSAEFAARTYDSAWLVDYVLKDAQPGIMAGPSKVLKTNISLELGVSLSSGKPFFGQHRVSQCNVGIVSAESGEETLQETAERVCKSKGIDFASLGTSLFWAFRPPQISEPSHISSLAHFIRKHDIHVLVIDPAYLTMGIGDDAKNQFVVGAVLQNLSGLQTETGVVPILCAHTNKNIPVGTELELQHIAYAGFGQWARQWFLLNRREPWNKEHCGAHKLFLSYGGSAGHSGSWALDIDEGDIRDGRVWEYTLQSAADVCRDVMEAAEQKRSDRKRQRENIAYEERRSKILKAMRRFPDGETEKEIRDASGLSGTAFKPIWFDLQESETIGSIGKIRKANGREYEAFKIINKADQ